jgi:hypothetical protein
MIIRMLSPISLGAFSDGVAQAGLGHARPVQRVRAVASPQPQPNSASTPPAVAPAARDGDSVPNRLLPRGSLLDLSV